MRNTLISQLLALVVLATLCLAPAAGFAQEEDERDRRDNQKTKQAQAVSKEVYETIQKAQELVDAKEFPQALRMIERLYNPEKLTNYEQANVLNYLGFIHYNMDNVPAALRTYQKMVEVPELEPQLLKQTTYTLAQLYTMEENYSRALGALDNWFGMETNPQPDPYILKAQNLYQLERYSEIIEPVETAMAVAREKGKDVKEEWYSLLNFAYFRMENYSKVRDIQKILLNNWPKKNYWFSLAGAFTELGEDQNLIKAYDAAYTQGMLEKENEFVTMAQLYLQAETPYKAATILETKMEDGTVSESEKNYRLLSQALMLSMEDQKAIPALTKAASFSEDGELDVRLGNSYLNIGEYDECSDAVRRGLDKGGLKNPDYAYISLGMCLYNQRQYSNARNAFREAGKTQRSRRTANQWITVIDADVERNRQIREAERAAQAKLAEVEKRRQEANRT